ncbi:hypothetical protein MKX01_024241 [Papaver californicum]|nr:hypothetical protein MKX01_024241 [Papaver californicum]
MGTYTFVLIVTVIVFILNSGSYKVDERQSTSQKENFEFKEQLKILDKPLIKTIYSLWGDIYDCTDIYKQPIFDHPLFKNHKIQVHLIRARYLSLSTGSISDTTLEYPNVNLNQYSLAKIYLRSGWDDQYTRIHPLYMTSIYDDTPFDMQFHIYLWYVIEGATIGYWLTEIFLYLVILVGYFPDEFLNHTAYFTQIQYNDASSNLFRSSQKMMTNVFGCKKHYDINHYGFREELGRRHSIQYGGLGEKC